MTIDEADALGQGRVWSAEDAFEHGLVDNLGTLEDAIEAAAARAELADYEVEFIQPYRSPRDLFLQQLADRVGILGEWPQSNVGAVLDRLLGPVARAVAEIDALQDPRSLYVRCVPCGGAF
jgi:protease-4